MAGAKIAEYIRQLLKEKNGSVAKAELVAKLPYLEEAEITRILRDHAPEIGETEMGGIPCWLDTTSHLPENFAACLTEIVDTLRLIERPVNQENLDFALSLAYREKFCETYRLSDKLVFRRVVEVNYQGEGNVFSARERGLGSQRSASAVLGRRTSAGRRTNLRFCDLGIPVGAVLRFKRKPEITVEVADDKSTVIYQGRPCMLSPLAHELLCTYFGRTGPHSVAGGVYWVYEGETLYERRERLERENAE